MTRVTIDAQTRSKLISAGAQAEVCDEKGATVGYFLTPKEYLAWMYEWARNQIDDEEIEQARHEPGGMSTAEAIAYVETIGGNRSSN